MDRPRILRLLHVSALVICLIPCSFLVALWIRSHKYHDNWDFVYPSRTGMLRVVSREGIVLFAPWVFGSGATTETGFVHHDISIAQLEANHAKAGKPLKKWSAWGYSKHNYPGGSIERDLFLPHWFLVVVVGSLGAVPW